MEVVYRTAQSEWADAGLAKKSLRWHRHERAKGNPLLDFNEAIAREEGLIRSFLNRAA